jgi:hypothetical protein
MEVVHSTSNGSEEAAQEVKSSCKDGMPLLDLAPRNMSSHMHASTNLVKVRSLPIDQIRHGMFDCLCLSRDI